MAFINKENDPDATVPYEDNFLDLGKFLYGLIRTKETHKFINFVVNSMDPDLDMVISSYKNRRGFDIINYAARYRQDEIVCCLIDELYRLNDIDDEDYVEYYKKKQAEIEWKYDQILYYLTSDKSKIPKFNRKNFEI